MRVLIIGGTGFIGSQTVRTLAASGHHVDVFHRGSTQADLPSTVGHIHGDRESLASVAAMLRCSNPDVVVDMVALTEAHARATLNVFGGFARRLVAVSSFDVYRAFVVFNRLDGGPLQPVPITEDGELRTNLFLARDLPNRPADRPPEYEKILVERVYRDQSELGATVLRLPIVYGPGDVRRRRTSRYVTRMMDGRAAILLDESLSAWTVTRGYVENVGAAIAEAVVNERAVGRTYNLGDVDALTEFQWVTKLAEAVGWSGRIVLTPRDRVPEGSRFGGNAAQHWVLDTSRIRRELGYQEPIALDEGLRRTVAWDRANPPESRPSAMDYQVEDQALAELPSQET
ncbi:MAG: NAD-dependent epimerase/dehydratase family protein [Acidobacteria bacterium]|nr:NAD-dependent epimerase/dehydratase family protein [Acidobacteriota bacterium]